MSVVISRRFKFYFLLVLSMLVSACASLEQTVTKDKVAEIWQQRKQRLSGVQDWHMKGRMVVVNGAELWAMSVDWQQKGNQYVIFLSGPFGAGKVQLAGSSNGVLLKDSDNQVFYAETPEELLLEHTGVAMPLSYLRFWMLGLPQPGSDSSTNNARFDEAGRLSSLSKDQWDVVYKRYLKWNVIAGNKPLDLPDKIFITRGEDIKVRVVVGEWLFDET